MRRTRLDELIDRRQRELGKTHDPRWYRYVDWQLAVICLVMLVTFIFTLHLVLNYENARLDNPATGKTRALPVRETTGIIKVHEWYDAGCCGDKDCHIAKPGEVTLRPDGIHVKTDKVNEVVAYSSPIVHPTKDPQGRAAVCEVPSVMNYGVTVRLQCVYIPGGQV